MSLRAALRGLALASVGALAVVAVATALTPSLRRRALALSGRDDAEAAPDQPTHIVLPDRAIAQWDGLAEAIEEGRQAASDVALAGA